MLISKSGCFKTSAANHRDACECLGFVIPAIVFEANAFALVTPRRLFTVITFRRLRSKGFNESESGSGTKMLTDESWFAFAMFTAMDNFFRHLA